MMRKESHRMARTTVGILALALSVMTVWPAGMVLADEPGTEALRAEIQALKDRLASLESRVSSGSAAPSGSSPGISVPSGVQGIELSGFVDTSYNYNFNEANNFANGFRVFDTESNGFQPHNAQLVVEKAASDDSPVGFKTSLMFGEDAEVVGGVTTGFGATGNEVEIQQAYAQYLAPIGNGLDIKFGKFATLHGAEVIESKDNWNFSRSYLFGFAIPFTHTGIRASYPLSESVTGIVGVSQGYDLVDEGNKAKSIEAALLFAPSDEFSLSAAYMVGAEQGNDSHDQRHLVDLVATYQPMEQLTLKLNTDFAQEEDAVSETGGGNAHWNGVAGYARYDITDRWAVAGRIEVFNDQDGVRTAVNASGTSPTGSAIDDIRFMEWTLTNELKLNEHLIARLEYRHDKADSAVFRHDQGFSDTQDTVAAEMIMPF